MHRRLLNGCRSRDRCRSGSFASNESSESLSSDSTALSDRQNMTRVFYNSRYSSARHKQAEQHTQENLDKNADIVNVSEDRLDEKNRDDVEPKWARNRTTNGHIVDADRNYDQNRQKNPRDRHSKGYYHNGYLCFCGRSQSRSVHDQNHSDTPAAYQSTDSSRSLDDGATCDTSSENSVNVSKSEESRPVSDVHQTSPSSEDLVSPCSSHALMNTPVPNVWKEREEFKRGLTPKSEEEEETMLRRALEESRISYEIVSPCYLHMAQDGRTSLDEWPEPIRTGANAVCSVIVPDSCQTVSSSHLALLLESENKNKPSVSVTNPSETGEITPSMSESSHTVISATFSLPVAPHLAPSSCSTQPAAISEPSCSSSFNASDALITTVTAPTSPPLSPSLDDRDNMEHPLPPSVDDRDNMDSASQLVELCSKSVEPPSSLTSCHDDIHASDILHVNNNSDIINSTSLQSNPVFIGGDVDPYLHIANQVISTNQSTQRVISACDNIRNESEQTNIIDVSGAVHHNVHISDSNMKSADSNVVKVTESAATGEKVNDDVSPAGVCVTSENQNHLKSSTIEPTSFTGEPCDRNVQNSSEEISQVNVSSGAGPDISTESQMKADGIEINSNTPQSSQIPSHYGLPQSFESQHNVSEAERHVSFSDFTETSPRPCFTPAYPPHFYHPGYWPVPHPGTVPYCPTGPGVMLPYMMPQGAGPPEACPRMMVVGPFIGPGGPFMPYPHHGPMMSGYHGDATESPARFPMPPMGYVVHAHGMHSGSMMVPNNGMMMPNNGMLVPSGGMMVPHSGMMVPHSGMMVPHNGMMVPSNAMMIPSNAMMVPNNGMMVPHGAMMSPDGSFSGRFMAPGGMYPGVVMVHEGGMPPRGFTGGECHPYPSHQAPSQHQNPGDAQEPNE